MLAGKLLAPLARTRTHGRKLETRILTRSGYHPVGYEVGAYDTETYLFHIRCYLFLLLLPLRRTPDAAVVEAAVGSRITVEAE